MIETVLLIAIILGLLFRKSNKKIHFPPGPTSLPLIGCSFYLLDLDFYNPQNTIRILYKNYGDVVGLTLAHMKVVVVSGWDAIREALTNDDVAGRPNVCIVKDLTDDGRKNGIVFTDGPLWRLQRRFTLHHFRNLGLGKKSHETVIHDEIESLIAELTDLKHVPTTIQQRLALSSINITWCMIGGKRFQRSDPQLGRLAALIDDLIHCFSVFGGPVVFMPILRHVFPNQSGYRTFISSSRGIAKFVNESIQEHMNRDPLELGDDDFISIYLKEMFKPTANESFSIQQLEGVCRDLLSGGTDTTSNTISFAIMFLCLNPGLEEKFFQEIESVIGGVRLPSIDDRPKCVFACAFINEVMRFRTITPTFIPHRAMADVRLQGYDVPKDSIVLLNYESVTMDKNYWGDPENFRPERFISPEGQLWQEERLINFGKGKRACTGEALGRMNVFLILTSLVQKFTLKFPEGGAPVSTNGVPGLNFSAPEFKVIFTQRKS